MSTPRGEPQTIKAFRDEGKSTSLAFESITFGGHIIDGTFKDLIDRLLKAGKDDCRRLTY